MPYSIQHDTAAGGYDFIQAEASLFTKILHQENCCYDQNDASKNPQIIAAHRGNAVFPIGVSISF